MTGLMPGDFDDEGHEEEGKAWESVLDCRESVIKMQLVDGVGGREGWDAGQSLGGGLCR